MLYWGDFQILDILNLNTGYFGSRLPLRHDLLAENEASLNTREARGLGRRFLNFGLADRDSRAPRPQENQTPLGPGIILQAKTAQSRPKDEVEASRKRQRHWHLWANSEFAKQ